MTPLDSDIDNTNDILDVESKPLRHKQTKNPQRSGTSISSTNNNAYNNQKVYPFYPRLIKRDLDYYQSSNSVNVQNVETYRSPIIPSTIKYVLSRNWFHILLRWPTFHSIPFLVALWFLGVVIFAHIYKVVDSNTPYEQCRLGEPGTPIAFSAAFAFSLQTCTTVGYGLPNSRNNFFEPECRAIQIAITCQMISSMLFNAFITAFLWCRLARCEQRGTQVVFGEKAIIEYRDGKWLFHVRIYDLDSKLPIVEAHVRFYCVSWIDYDNQIKQHEQAQLTEWMRVLNPNDDHGSLLFASIPLNATHHIDVYSPLAPAHLKKDLNYFQGNGLKLREADQFCGSNAKTFCPVCGETYETFEQLERHIAFNKIIEDNASPEIPKEGTHRDESILKPNVTKKFEISKEDIQNNLQGKEILVLVEGIEPMISGTFQALHSYKLEDIAFDSCFAPCVSQRNGKTVVDLDRFHEILPLPGGRFGNSSGYDSCGSTCSNNSLSSRRTILPHVIH